MWDCIRVRRHISSEPSGDTFTATAHILILNTWDCGYAIAWFMCVIYICVWVSRGGPELIIPFCCSSMFCRVKTSTKMSGQSHYISTFYSLSERGFIFRVRVNIF